MCVLIKFRDDTDTDCDGHSNGDVQFYRDSDREPLAYARAG